MTTVAFLNQKGGVGKTSTTYHLAGALARRGERVLLVDADPQASLTQGFWGPEATAALAPQATVAAIFGGLAHSPSLLLAATAFEGIDLIRGSAALNDWNTPRPHEAAAEAQHGLRLALAEVGRGYDHVLIDCPPNLNLCAWAALAAADLVVVPLQAEDFGAQGIAAVAAAIRRARHLLRPQLGDPSYLITMFQARLKVHQLYEEKLRRDHGGAVLRARVPLAAGFKEAILAQMPVAYYAPRSAAAKAIGAVADELFGPARTPAAAAGKGVRVG